MLDFHRHRRAARPSGPALERRMLALGVSTAVVLLLILGAGNPRNWTWLTGGNAPPAAVARLDQPEHVVIARAAEPNEPPQAGSEAGPPGPQDKPAEAPDEVRRFPGVRMDYLSAVRDDTVFRPAESDAWFHLFALVARTSDEELQQASEGPVAYLQLDQQPREYRGRLVTIDGIARAARRITAPANAFEVKHYYQVWLQPDRQSDGLIVVYCTQLPTGFPLGEQIAAECSATGFFFKRWAYPSQGGITTAPLVIAKTLSWQPPPVVAEGPPPPPLGEQLLIAAAAALLLAIIALLVILRRGRTSPAVASAEPPSDVAARLAALDEQQHVPHV
jgi:hypothetical protein